jgi:multiple sugar transport system ATP-binding protein
VPTSGAIKIGERDVTHLPSKDRDIAMVFQSYALYPNMNVAQNIAFGLEMRKVPKAEREAAVDRVARMLQIGHLLDRKPGQLSGGQRQRVAMGRALARDPKLFLFDEPLSNLDAKLRVEMRAEIKLLHQRTQTTTVYVTHDQVEAMTLGDRIAVMKDGVVQQFGTPDDIYARPATLFVAEFIGSPAMNLLPAQRSGGGLAAQGSLLPLAPQQAGRLPAGAGEWRYGIRPEDIELLAAGSPDSLPARISMLEPTGPETYVRVEAPVGALTLRVPGKVSAAVGDSVGLRWPTAAVHLFEAASGLRLP